MALGGCADPAPESTTAPTTASDSIVLPLGAIECVRGRDPLGTRVREIQGTAGQPTPAPPDSEEVPIERQPLPANFEPVAAVLCIEMAQDGAGSVAYAQRLADIEIEGLVDILRMEDEAPSTEACDSYHDPQPNLWLVDEDGSVVAPRWPLDGCGHLRAPKPEVAIPDSSLVEPAAGGDS